MIKIKIHFDGSCKNAKDKQQPTGYGVAVFIEDEFSEEFSKSEYGELGTSNIAEWQGCVEAMKVAYEIRRLCIKLNQPTIITIHSDSQLITRQFNGRYQVKDPKFLKYYLEAHRYSELARIQGGINWLRREFNSEADRLAGLGRQKYLQKKV